MAIDRYRHVLFLIALAGLLVFWLNTDFFGYEILAEIAVFAILAMSLEIVAGYAGLVSLGHAALFGIGAYLFSALTLFAHWPVLPAMIGASILTGILSILVGAVVTRVQGIFFIMITLAMGEMAHEFFFKYRALGGDDGLSGIPRLDLSLIGVDLTDSAQFALLLIGFVVVVYALLTRILSSPYGLVLTGLHDNPQRMRATGLPVQKYQISVFALSGLIAGFAGTLTAQHSQFISPELLHWTVSGEILVMVILGGMATLVGPVIGAIVLIMLRHGVSGYTDYWGLWMGLVLIAVVMGGRNGLVDWLDYFRPKTIPENKKGTADASR